MTVIFQIAIHRQITAQFRKLKFTVIKFLYKKQLLKISKNKQIGACYIQVFTFLSWMVHMNNKHFALIAGLTLAASFSAHAQQKTNIYDCVDKTTLQQNAECIANTISNNAQLKQEIALIEQDAANFNQPMALAMMTMNPQDLSIEVVALTNKTVEKTQN